MSTFRTVAPFAPTVILALLSIFLVSCGPMASPASTVNPTEPAATLASQSTPTTPAPPAAVKYQRHTPSAYNIVILDYSYLMKNTLLPVTMHLGDETVIVKEVTVRKSGENGFSVDALVSSGRQESSIGFSRLDRRIEWENGCAWESVYDLCTPFGTDLIVKEWAREPTPEEKYVNVFEVRYYRSIDILEIDYDVTSNEWNYLKFALGETKGIVGVAIPEDEGKVKVSHIPEVQALAQKYGWPHVHINALDIDAVRDVQFIRKIHPNFREETGCIIVVHAGEEGYVYQEDKELNIIYTVTIQEFIQSTKTVDPEIMARFYLSLH